MKTAHILKHVMFEGPGVFGDTLRDLGYELKSYLVPEEGLPEGDFDLLLVMGGPMSVNDSDPWIAEETAFIRRAIVDLHKSVLGICLGSQFIAKALGGSVSPGPGAEIGLTEVTLTEAGRNDACFERFPDAFEVVEWHGEGISAPPDAVVLASSPLFPIQAFRYRQNVYGLLFHLEMDEEAVSVLCRECPGDLARVGVTAEETTSRVTGRLGEVQQNARTFLRNLLTRRPRPSSSVSPRFFEDKDEERERITE